MLPVVSPLKVQLAAGLMPSQLMAQVPEPLVQVTVVRTPLGAGSSGFPSWSSAGLAGKQFRPWPSGTQTCGSQLLPHWLSPSRKRV